MKHSVASVTYYDCVATLVESGAQQSAPGTETAVMNANTDGREQLDWIDVVSGDCRRDRDLREISSSSSSSSWSWGISQSQSSKAGEREVFMSKERGSWDAL